jgi:hypothetical protein
MRETDLYLPLKKYLERLGYDVKAEINGCDVVAVREAEPPLIIELKRGLTLLLLYQAVDRLALSETVYVAIAKPKRAVPSEAVKLCRRLGLGLIVIAKSGSIDVLAEPVPYRPKPAAKRQAALLKEFKSRKGDPNLGGSTRTKLMTAYKQDALRCLNHIHVIGPAKISDIRKATQVERASSIFQSNYYTWFERHTRGVYGLTDEGRAAARKFQNEIKSII